MGRDTQTPPGIGHNQPPKDKPAKTKKPKGPQPFGLKAKWLKSATEEEIRILARNHMRLERKRQGMKDIEAENRQIMNRNIRRMRRAQGKDKPKSRTGDET